MKMKPIRKLPQVLLLIESSRGYGRNCLMGIASYMRTHGHWQVLHLERGLQEKVPANVERQRFDGVIARMENAQIARSINRMGVPTVDLRGLFQPPGGVCYNTDPSACALMALEHFRQRGFRQLAYCGYPGVDFSDARCTAFKSLCESAGIPVYVFDAFAAKKSTKARQSKKSRSSATPRINTLAREAKGEMDEALIAKWLLTLPKPLGIFACNDMRGRQVLNAVRSTELRVPDHVAVLGVDDDEVICDLANPPLSSIQPDALRIGFEGAEMLDRLMAGETPDQETVLVPPVRVSIRTSTDVLAVDDMDLAEAIQFIRAHGCDGIGVQDVLEATSISRATLERRFREILDRSPREEIERVRIDRIRMLLAETNYGLEKIATMTSYRTAAHLVTAFRRIAGCTPGQYRSQFRG
ncbi:substrate-binding domain-containing protein [Novipirellula herctigrandis]